MGVVYLFSEALNAAQILAIYQLGPSYKVGDMGGGSIAPPAACFTSEVINWPRFICAVILALAGFTLSVWRGGRTSALLLQGAFKYKCESDLVIIEQQRALLYDGRLYGCIAFSYNPRATDGQLCLECSGRDQPSLFLHRPHAFMLQVGASPS